MAVSGINTVRKLIMWKYAGLVAGGARTAKASALVRAIIFSRLESGEMALGEEGKSVSPEPAGVCAFCGETEGVSSGMLISHSRGGYEVPENTVPMCAECRAQKGEKRLYEFLGLGSGRKVHAGVEAKYLAAAYARHESLGTLDKEAPCAHCDMAGQCEKEGHAGRLTDYCIEGVFVKTGR